LALQAATVGLGQRGAVISSCIVSHLTQFTLLYLVVVFCSE
jgi:hypothetical protein